jgi:hypothetical protein
VRRSIRDSRSALIRVFDVFGAEIETHESAGDFREITVRFSFHSNYAARESEPSILNPSAL